MSDDGTLAKLTPARIHELLARRAKHANQLKTDFDRINRLVDMDLLLGSAEHRGEPPYTACADGDYVVVAVRRNCQALMLHSTSDGTELLVRRDLLAALTELDAIKAKESV